MLVLTVLRAGLLPATPPNALPAGTLSDGTISSGGRSPSRQRRPHSVAGRLPNYASPTVASQCRMARGLEKTFAGNLTVCYRCSKFVSIPFLFYVILNTMFSCVMCLLASRVLGQNGRGQNGTDKMVWTKWYWTKWYGQNGMDKMLQINYQSIPLLLTI